MGSTIEDLRKTVLETYKSGDWKSCSKACMELHKKNPENIAVTMKMADVFVKSGQKNNAVKAYNMAAETYKKNGDFLQAIGVYKMILKFAPGLKEVEDKIEELCSGKSGGVKENALPDIPLLSDLNSDELVEVVNSLKHLSFAMGEMICRAGDEGTSIYVIVSGSVKIFIEGIAGEKIEIAQLKEGDFFGEAGFFAGGKRQASVMAMDDSELLEITKTDFERIVESYPRVGEVLEEFYRKRILDKLLAVSPLFSMLKDMDRKDLLKAFKLRNFNEGDTVIREGDAGDALFIIKSGRAKVSTSDPESGHVALGELKEGDFFGEVSLVTGKPRTATVTAASNLELMELSKSDLKKCIDKYPKVEEVLKNYMKARVDKTIGKIMALKEIQAKEGLV